MTTHKLTKNTAKELSNVAMTFSRMRERSTVPKDYAKSLHMNEHFKRTDIIYIYHYCIASLLQRSTNLLKFIIEAWFFSIIATRKWLEWKGTSLRETVT